MLYSTIAVDTKCLACYTDGIWYPATVTEVKDHIISVHFDDYGEDMDVDITQVVPSGELACNCVSIPGVSYSVKENEAQSACAESRHMELVSA